MQSTASRYLILAFVFALGLLLFAAVPRPSAHEPRAPTDEDVFNVEGWTTVNAARERINDTEFVAREYRSASGAEARFVLKAGTAAKAVYRASPEVPFVGSGYEVAPAPSTVVPQLEGAGGVVITRGAESYVLLHAYGERRGLLGNGLAGWTTALFDGVLGVPNDYYEVTLLAPFASQPEDGARSAELAQALFARTAAWYGQLAFGSP
jgi:hypothetical protein